MMISLKKLSLFYLTLNLILKSTYTLLTTKYGSNGSTNQGNATDVNPQRVLNKEGPWPKCLGRDCQVCSRLVRLSAPDVSVIQLIYPGMVVTTDHRLERVRIFVDKNCNVIKVPQRG